MHSRVLKSLSRLAVLAIVAAGAAAVVAQDTAKPAAKGSQEQSPSRWDIFVGYSYLSPHDTIDVLQRDGVTVLPEQYKSMNYGIIGSGAYYFNKYVGAQVEVGTHDTFTNDTSSNDAATTASGGLIFRLPTNDITPFVHGLVGGVDLAGPQHEPYTWGVALTAGGGMDYETPWFNHHLAIRFFQADYEYMHVNFGPGIWQGRANINAARLSGGLVWHVGSLAPPPPVTLACSASPTAVFPGEPVTITSTASELNPKLNAIYSFSGDGVTGNGNSASVSTANLAAGSHTVNCGVKEGKPGKEGLKPWESAQASTTFTVKEFEPPTISCSVSPTTIKPGDSATITATAASPQNRPLTYTYTASAGTVNGNGSSATFSSTGAPTGPISITCNVADDKGHNASANASLNIEAPPPPPQPHTQTLCSINFTTDKARPTRVDNEAKACLDEVALDLQRQSDAKAVVVGESNGKEKAKQEKEQKFAARHKRAKVTDFAGERAVNTKDYLVKEKGIDPSRISVATGTADDQKVEDYLVPAGASFGSDVQGTTPVDENVVMPQTRKPLPQRKHHHKAAASK